MAAISLALLSGAVIVMGALHLIRSDMGIVHHPLSFYVHGEHGWLLPLALAMFGASALALGFSFRAEARGPAAAGWLISFGGGMLLAALAPADRWFPWQQPPSTDGAIHALVAVVAPPLLLGAMFEIRRRPANVPPRLKTWMDVLGVAYTVGLVASGASLLAGFLNGSLPPFIGLAERILALAAVGWMALVACNVARRS